LNNPELRSPSTFSVFITNNSCSQVDKRKMMSVWKIENSFEEEKYFGKMKEFEDLIEEIDGHGFYQKRLLYLVWYSSIVFSDCCREHWIGEVSADKWVPNFPVFIWPLVLWKNYFVFIKMTYSSRYSFVAFNSWYA